MMRRARWLGFLVVVLMGLAGAVRAEDAGGAVLAWVRFEDADQDYRGTRYRFLGDGALALTIEATPGPGHVLALLWGAKNDAREAVALINGRRILLSQGGYDGFRWLRVPVPEGLTGPLYEVLLSQGKGKAAFLGEIRLEGRDGGPSVEMKAASSGIAVRVAAIEAFPEMRPLWDREPAPWTGPPLDPAQEALFREAERNARAAAEGLYRCRRYVDGWLAHADPKSGLIPRNLGASRDLWNGRDAAADNYPFMVLTCALTDEKLFRGRMRDMLRAETRLTSRIDRLPDHYLFSTGGFATEEPNLDQILFDASEYVKDGLIPLTEWLGRSPWSERMIGLVDDVWKHAPVETPFGKIPTRNVEVSGDQLQACARLYWLTGERKYLDWAIRLADYFLLGENHPTRHFKTLSFFDHACEVINGLSEVYLAVSYADPEKKRAYEAPMHEMLDRILEIGRNEHGLLWGSVNPKTGEHSNTLCDTWGYNYDAFYTLYLVDGTEAYREAVRKVLGNLKEHYSTYRFPSGADGAADSIEGGINLFNREPLPGVPEWIDAQTRAMWAIQKEDGVIEGWHGDGNFARTTLMYALWKSRGVTAMPWRDDLRVGAARDGEALCISLTAGKPWRGRVRFDQPRHKTHLRLPVDYPRINQFPEWFTAEAGRRYVLRDLASGRERRVSGKSLQEGISLRLRPGVEVRWRIEP